MSVLIGKPLNRVGADKTYIVGTTAGAPANNTNTWIVPGTNTVNRRLIRGGSTLDDTQVSYDRNTKTFTLLGGLLFFDEDSLVVEQY